MLARDEVRALRERRDCDHGIEASGWPGDRDGNAGSGSNPGSAAELREKVQEKDFTLVLGGGITGRVLRKDNGEPIADARVVVALGNMMGMRPGGGGGQKVGTGTARTDETGTFRISNLMPVPVLSGQEVQGLAALDEDAYVRLTQKVMLHLANQGNVVIMGRGSQTYLAHRTDTLHVRIVAPNEYRIQTVMERDGLNRAEAVKQIQKVDEQRRRYIKRHYGIKGNAPSTIT